MAEKKKKNDSPVIPLCIRRRFRETSSVQVKRHSCLFNANFLLLIKVVLPRERFEALHARDVGAREQTSPLAIA